jgi:hypothetical protein
LSSGGDFAVNERSACALGEAGLASMPRVEKLRFSARSSTTGGGVTGAVNACHLRFAPRRKRAIQRLFSDWAMSDPGGPGGAAWVS